MSPGRIGGLAVVLIAAGLWGRSLYADANAPYVLVEAGDIERSVLARGVVVAASGVVRVVPTSAARVLSVSVQVGDRVRADDALAPLEVLGPPAPFDPLGEEEALRAPIAGTVLSRHVEPGDVLNPMVPTLEPSFEIADTDHLELRLEIEEHDADAIVVGARARLLDDETRITRLAPRIERREHPFDDVASRASAAVRLAWADLPEGSAALLGQHVEVRIDEPIVHVEAVLPRTAIVIRDGHAVVRVRDGMFVREVRVTLGAVDAENVEVRGLDAGTEVLLAS